MFTSKVKLNKFFVAIGALIFTGIALSVFAFITANNWHRQKLLADFSRAAENRYTSLTREIDSDMQALLALKAFYLHSGKITRSQFRAFSTPLLMKHPSIQALEWIPRIRNSEREEYEKAAKREGYSGFHITERAAQGKMTRAGQREEYFPVYFVEPYKGNEIALGFDLASNPTRK